MLSSWTFLGPKKKSAEKLCLGPATKKDREEKIQGEASEEISHRGAGRRFFV